MKRKILSLLFCLTLFLGAAHAAESEELPWANPFRGGENGLYGLHDGAFPPNILLPPEYDYIGLLSDDGYGYAEVQKGELWGLVDARGNFTIPLEYGSVRMGEDGVATVQNKDGLFAYFQASDGTPLTDFCFHNASDFIQLGVAYKRIDDKDLYGAVNAQRETLIPFEYDYLSDPVPDYYPQHIISARKGAYYGAFNYDGSLLRRVLYPSDVAMRLSLFLPAQMTEEEELSALAAASQTWEPVYVESFGRWAYQATETGGAYAPAEYVIGPRFTSAQPFDSSGRARVTLPDGQSGYIEPSGTFYPDPQRFTDVPAGSWFEQGVLTCAENGIMVGTGEGLFSPEAELSAAQCLTLALRLYDLQRGRDGTFETAPEDWGKIELTLADGTTFTRYGYQNEFFSQSWFTLEDGTNGLQLYVLAPGDTTQEQEAWAQAHQGKGYVTVAGMEYPGSLIVGENYLGPLLYFVFGGSFSDEIQLVVSASVDATRPGPDKWFRNAVYTAERWGLSDQPGFDSLIHLCYGNSGPEGRCDREIFAKALQVAAGELEKRYDVEKIPDLGRAEYNESIYRLYEAGILNGLDDFGTFWGDKTLTRAEAAVMVARVLDPAQRLTAAPTPPNAYEQAVIDLRTEFTYYLGSERTYETDDCTVFVYDRGGAMHVGKGNINIIYKPGSQPGAGTVIRGESPLWIAFYQNGPDRVDFDVEANTLTYAYRVEEDLSGWGEDAPIIKAGIHTYTVNLPTAETTRTYAPFSLEASAEVLAKGRNYTLEQRLDGENCAAILRWHDLTWTDDTRDYELWLVHGDGAIQKLLLPSTTLQDHDYYSYTPTDRIPDSMAFSEDGKTFTYVYSFDMALKDGENVLHEAGTYTYTIDLSTGELNVTHTAD